MHSEPHLYVPVNEVQAGAGRNEGQVGVETFDDGSSAFLVQDPAALQPQTQNLYKP